MAEIDAALSFLYDESTKGGGLDGASYPSVNKWLGDIKKYFPVSVVHMLQKEAIEKLELTTLLSEPDLLMEIEVDIELLSMLISMSHLLPEATKKTAREVVERAVREIMSRLEWPVTTLVRGSLKSLANNYRPKTNEINWHKTIRANLKHYQKDLNTLIPERLIGFSSKKNHQKHIFLVIDQSGSMKTSFVYACIMGAILASIPALETKIIAFNTSVVDLSEKASDPVDILFGGQIGGGTDIGNALRYAQKAMTKPQDTILFLISDLEEGGPLEVMFETVGELINAGTQIISLLALDEKGTPAYDKTNATRFGTMGIAAFGCTPDQFPELLSVAIRKGSVHDWASQNRIMIRG